MRSDIQTAHIVSSLYGAQGGKLSLNDAMLQWGKTGNGEADDGLEGFLKSVSET
ncbi:phage tail assembly protein T [Morganella morganii]|uniref:phage tail assembly protein T n=1 Tax=Morganella morganii TaxID=582 RepID=UPI003CD0E051